MKEMHGICLFELSLLHLAWWSSSPSIVLQMSWFQSSVWMNETPLQTAQFLYLFISWWIPAKLNKKEVEQNFCTIPQTWEQHNTYSSHSGCHLYWLLLCDNYYNSFFYWDKCINIYIVSSKTVFVTMEVSNLFISPNTVWFYYSQYEKNPASIPTYNLPFIKLFVCVYIHYSERHYGSLYLCWYHGKIEPYYKYSIEILFFSYYNIFPALEAFIIIVDW